MPLVGKGRWRSGSCYFDSESHRRRSKAFWRNAVCHRCRPQAFLAERTLMQLLDGKGNLLGAFLCIIAPKSSDACHWCGKAEGSLEYVLQTGDLFAQERGILSNPENLNAVNGLEWTNKGCDTEWPRTETSRGTIGVTACQIDENTVARPEIDELWQGTTWTWLDGVNRIKQSH